MYDEIALIAPKCKDISQDQPTEVFGWLLGGHISEVAYVTMSKI